MNLRLGRWSQLLAPGFGWCLRCKTPWRFTEPHPTTYQETSLQQAGRACFPLCEKCWAELVPAERLPFYDQLWRDWWKAPEDPPWPRIRDAVLSGK